MHIMCLSCDLSPLDDLIDQLGGVECVSEMTGRRGRMVRVRGNRVQYELRDTGGSALESLNNREVGSFLLSLASLLTVSVLTHSEQPSWKGRSW